MAKGIQTGDKAMIVASLAMVEQLFLAGCRPLEPHALALLKSVYCGKQGVITTRGHMFMFGKCMEWGHIYYFLAYKEQPFPFRTGANDGFHEGIGDTLALSCTTAYLRQIGILPPALSPDPKLELQARVNSLMKMALDKIAFLPFGFAVDAYRCSTPVAVSVKMSLTCLQMERLQWQRAALILHIQLVEAASAVPGHRSCTASF
jgi:hypothetical protein